MDRKKITKNIIRILCVLFLGAALFAAEKVMGVRSINGIDQAKAMYYEPRNKADAVFMGSSHMHCDVNTAMLWEDKGIASFCYSTAEQPIWVTYYYLRELLKYQKPQTVFLDLYSIACIKEEYHYKWLEESILGFRFSPDKVRMLLTACERGMIKEYFPSIAVWHGRYEELDEDDFAQLTEQKEELSSFKGYTPYFRTEAQEKPAIHDYDTAPVPLLPKAEEYLRKTIEYAQEQGVQLVLMVTPYVTCEEDERIFARISRIAQEYGIDYYDLNEEYDIIGIDFQNDFNDYSHLNYGGSCKYTRYLEEEILPRYELPDRRGKAGYETWDIHVERIDKSAEEYWE